MGISIIRIDDRLIHGQVVEGWLRSVKINNILIISEKLADKEEEKILFSLAIRGDIAVDCLKIGEAAEKLKGNYYKNSKVMVLVESPREILALLELGVKIESVNVGGMHFSPGKSPVNDFLYLDREDCSVFEQIIQRGVVVEGRALPKDKSIDVAAEIKKLKNKLFK